MRTLLLLYLCAYAAWATDDGDYDDYDSVSHLAGLMRFPVIRNITQNRGVTYFA